MARLVKVAVEPEDPKEVGRFRRFLRWLSKLWPGELSAEHAVQETLRKGLRATHAKLDKESSAATQALVDIEVGLEEARLKRAHEEKIRAEAGIARAEEKRIQAEARKIHAEATLMELEIQQKLAVLNVGATLEQVDGNLVLRLEPVKEDAAEGIQRDGFGMMVDHQGNILSVGAVLPEGRNHMSVVQPEQVDRVKRHLERQAGMVKNAEERIHPTIIKRRARRIPGSDAAGLEAHTEKRTGEHETSPPLPSQSINAKALERLQLPSRPVPEELSQAVVQSETPLNDVTSGSEVSSQDVESPAGSRKGQSNSDV